MADRASVMELGGLIPGAFQPPLPCVRPSLRRSPEWSALLTYSFFPRPIFWHLGRQHGLPLGLRRQNVEGCHGPMCASFLFLHALRRRDSGYAYILSDPTIPVAGDRCFRGPSPAIVAAYFHPLSSFSPYAQDLDPRLGRHFRCTSVARLGAGASGAVPGLRACLVVGGGDMVRLWTHLGGLALRGPSSCRRSCGRPGGRAFLPAAAAPARRKCRSCRSVPELSNLTARDPPPPPAGYGSATLKIPRFSYV